MHPRDATLAQEKTRNMNVPGRKATLAVLLTHEFSGKATAEAARSKTLWRSRAGWLVSRYLDEHLPCRKKFMVQRSNFAAGP